MDQNVLYRMGGWTTVGFAILSIFVIVKQYNITLQDMILFFCVGFLGVEILITIGILTIVLRGFRRGP